jgi:hypothetical protein
MCSGMGILTYRHNVLFTVAGQWRSFTALSPPNRDFDPERSYVMVLPPFLYRQDYTFADTRT